MISRSLMVLGSLFLAVSCGGGGGDDDTTGVDASVSPTCMEATMHDDLAWIQDNVFTRSCAAFSSCHRGSAAGAAGLNLEDGMSEGNLVNIDSTLNADYKLVLPGDSGNSYLLFMLGREPVPSDVTINRTMPLGNPLLCDEKIEAVARWVDGM